jgi:hypothetical protein
MSRSAMGYDGSEDLFGPYNLSDLCVTQTGLPNLPQDLTTFNNLQSLAALLSGLTTDVGPFTVLSGFRTPAVQAALASSGEPVPPAGKLSFHEVGLAADIAPTTMPLAQFFGMMLAAGYQDLCAEIAYKPSQNSIHLAVAVPYKVGVVLALDPTTNTYGPLSQDAVDSYADPYVEAGQAVAAVDTSDDSGFDTADPGTVAAGFGGIGSIGMLAIATTALGYLFASPSKKSSSAKSPMKFEKLALVGAAVAGLGYYIYSSVMPATATVAASTTDDSDTDS